MREGVFCVNECFEKMFTVFFDTGALYRSYINKNTVDKHRKEWESKIRPFEVQVRLADQKTVVRTTEIIRGVLSFMSDDGKEFKDEVDAIVWNMKGLEPRAWSSLGIEEAQIGPVSGAGEGRSGIG